MMKTHISCKHFLNSIMMLVIKYWIHIKLYKNERTKGMSCVYYILHDFSQIQKYSIQIQ